MRRLMVVLTTAIFMATGCSDHYLDPPVDYPPAAPNGVYSITGDGKISLYWNANTEPDLDLYAVYLSETENGRYELEGTTRNTFFDAYVQNGETFYFAVAAIDYSGNESDLSYEMIWDTPRPEGRNLVVFALYYDSLKTNFEHCGVDFSDFKSGMTQALDNPSNDVYIDNYDGVIFLNAFDDDTDIAMFGRTKYLEDVDYADPELLEWTDEGYLPLYEDYSYVIWTWDNHFATIRVQEVYRNRVLIEWAYQTDEGNPQLKIAAGADKDRSLKLRVPKTIKSVKIH